MDKIRLSKSVVGNREKGALVKAIDNGYLGMEREVQAFEKEIAQFLEVPIEWVICVNSRTRHFTFTCNP